MPEQNKQVCSLQKMGNYININAHEYYGLSTDTKPMDCPTGSAFLEMDTKQVYVFDGVNKKWYQL